MARKNKIRVDELLVGQKVIETLAKAQALIMQGHVQFRLKAEPSAAWQDIEKAGQPLNAEEVELRLKPGTQNLDVGRGAQKLKKALDHWTQIKPVGARCLDVGSSTGGFTQVLLDRGAAQVVAMDVGTHQLHEKLRADPRVVVMEQTHVLKVDAAFWNDKAIEPRFSVIVTDLSFISLTKIIHHVAPWLASAGHWVLLIKPQFELGPHKVPGGIVKEAKYHLEAIERVRAVIQSQSDLEWRDLIESPIKGGDGNTEFLLWVSKK